jgi:2-polyprenyl-6-methoxyphenol hydroxylase-like FAD-dependent oxidoreductase
MTSLTHHRNSAAIVAAMMIAVSVTFSALMIDAFVVPSPALVSQNNIHGKSSSSTIVPTTGLFSTTETPASDSTQTTTQKQSKADFVICGGGPAGLLTAIMLIQKFPDQKIKLFDRLPPPFSPTDENVWNDVAKFYLIGLGGRGQTALDKFGVWDPVRDVCTAVVGRKDWAPDSAEGVENIFVGRKFKTEVLPRDKLVAVLHQHITENYSSDQIELNHGFEVVPVALDENENQQQALVDVFRCEGEQETDVECQMDATERISTKLLIAADGTARTVANYMEDTDRKERKVMNPLQKMFAGKPFTVTRYNDDNRRIYKTIPMKLPEDWRPDLNYSARSQKGGMNIDALPANRKGNYCGVLLLKENDPMAQANTDPKALRGFLDDLLPQFSAFLDDEVLEKVAKKPPSYLPSFRFVGPRLNQGDHTLILGDCAHTVKVRCKNRFELLFGFFFGFPDNCFAPRMHS